MTGNLEKAGEAHAIQLGAGAFGGAARIFRHGNVLFSHRGGNQREIQDVLFPQCRARPCHANGTCGRQPAARRDQAAVGNRAFDNRNVKASSNPASAPTPDPGGRGRSSPPPRPPRFVAPMSSRVICRCWNSNAMTAATLMAATRRVKPSLSAVIRGIRVPATARRILTSASVPARRRKGLPTGSC